jgi:hypothetical protein
VAVARPVVQIDGQIVQQEGVVAGEEAVLVGISAVTDEAELDDHLVLVLTGVVTGQVGGLEVQSGGVDLPFPHPDVGGVGAVDRGHVAIVVPGSIPS